MLLDIRSHVRHNSRSGNRSEKGNEVHMEKVKAGKGNFADLREKLAVLAEEDGKVVAQLVEELSK